MKRSDPLPACPGNLRIWAQASIAQEEKIERMQARATAIDQLLSSGALENLSGDHIEEELRRHSDQHAIDERLEELKEQHKQGDTK